MKRININRFLAPINHPGEKLRLIVATLRKNLWLCLLSVFFLTIGKPAYSKDMLLLDYTISDQTGLPGESFMFLLPEVRRLLKEKDVDVFPVQKLDSDFSSEYYPRVCPFPEEQFWDGEKMDFDKAKLKAHYRCIENAKVGFVTEFLKKHPQYRKVIKIKPQHEFNGAIDFSYYELDPKIINKSTTYRYVMEEFSLSTNPVKKHISIRPKNTYLGHHEINFRDYFERSGSLSEAAIVEFTGKDIDLNEFVENAAISLLIRKYYRDPRLKSDLTKIEGSFPNDFREYLRKKSEAEK